MDINEIYSTIFPIGGIDDNNRYTNLTGDQINTVQLAEPSLSVEKIGLTYFDRKSDKANIPDKYGYRVPVVAIDGKRLKPTDITAFRLDYKGIVPYVMVEFIDYSNSMLSTNVIKDGSILQVYIGGNGDELYYKPIRQDFVITNVKKSMGEDQNHGGYLAYKVSGKLNVPYLYRKEGWCGGESTAMQALFNVAVYTGLGFATNFTTQSTPDLMNWINTETSTYLEFIENISGHACYSPNTFFTSFIDQYNVLNFIECHSLLSHGGLKTDMPAMIYTNVPPISYPNYEGGEKTTKNQIEIKDKKETDENNSEQRVSYYFLSNNEYFKGWSNFVNEYTEINNGNTSISDGYISHVGYSDSNSSSWGFSVVDFKIRPIDNLPRDPSTQKILSLDDTVSQSSYIPLNLMQTNKEDYQKSEKDSVDDMTNVESFSTFGEVDTNNTFKLYYFAEVQNRYQMKCLKKCGLLVTLQNYNPSITKYSRIWVDIYDKNMSSNEAISKSKMYSNDDKTNKDFKKIKESKNANILRFDDEGIVEDFYKNKDNKGQVTNNYNNNQPRGEYNRSLSGWYVVTEITIDYDFEESNLNMILKLNRIEYQPCFVSDYNIAKKAIEIYKEDNLIENIIESKDDLSYQE